MGREREVLCKKKDNDSESIGKDDEGRCGKHEDMFYWSFMIVR